MAGRVKQPGTKVATGLDREAENLLRHSIRFHLGMLVVLLGTLNINKHNRDAGMDAGVQHHGQ